VPKENVFNGSGCSGANLSPEFHWSDAPTGTKSFAITIFDLDAPTGGGWWHWVILIFQERSWSYLQAQAAKNQEGYHLLAFNAGMITGSRDMEDPVLRVDQPIDIW
jgi:Raf kinase inhibitor-like YbhB/YbcL family protein